MAPTNKSDKTRFPRKRFEQVCKAVVRSTTVKMMLFPTVANTNAIPFMMLVITVEMYKGLWLAWSKITSRKKQLKFSEGCVRFDVPINVHRWNEAFRFKSERNISVASTAYWSLISYSITISYAILMCFPSGKLSLTPKLKSRKSSKLAFDEWRIALTRQRPI